MNVHLDLGDGQDSQKYILALPLGVEIGSRTTGFAVPVCLYLRVLTLDRVHWSREVVRSPTESACSFPGCGSVNTRPQSQYLAEHHARNSIMDSLKQKSREVEDSSVYLTLVEKGEFAFSRPKV